MKSSAAIAEKVNLGLSRRKNGGRVAVAKPAQVPKVDIDERQYLFFFADPRETPKAAAPVPRSSHRWGSSKQVGHFDHMRIIKLLPKRYRSSFLGRFEVCTHCSVKRYQVICRSPGGWTVRKVIFESIKGLGRTRPPCAGFLK